MSVPRDPQQSVAANLISQYAELANQMLDNNKLSSACSSAPGTFHGRIIRLKREFMKLDKVQCKINQLLLDSLEELLISKVDSKYDPVKYLQELGITIRSFSEDDATKSLKHALRLFEGYIQKKEDIFCITKEIKKENEENNNEYKIAFIKKRLWKASEEKVASFCIENSQIIYEKRPMSAGSFVKKIHSSATCVDYIQLENRISKFESEINKTKCHIFDHTVDIEKASALILNRCEDKDTKLIGDYLIARISSPGIYKIYYASFNTKAADSYEETRGSVDDHLLKMASIVGPKNMVNFFDDVESVRQSVEEMKKKMKKLSKRLTNRVIEELYLDLNAGPGTVTLYRVSDSKQVCISYDLIKSYLSLQDSEWNHLFDQKDYFDRLLNVKSLTQKAKPLSMKIENLKIE